MLKGSIKPFKERAAKKKIELIENIPERLMANVDKGMFCVTINNLLENAIKYTNEGKISVDAHETSGEVLIYVRDTGIGVPEDEREKIFDKFYRGRALEIQKKDGIGIGLYLSKRYIELNGGTFTYESEIEKKKNRKGIIVEKEIGSIFTIRIPKE
jgi:signal transduction histidine kinase